MLQQQSQLAPLISIVIPVYNVERFLPQCVDSVLQQTCGSIEVILVDDGSPDSCPELCDAYAKRDSRVRVIHQKNKGISAARNRGLGAAAGEYVYFLDSDDFIESTALERLAGVAERGGLDVVFFDGNVVDEGGDEVEGDASYRRTGPYDAVCSGKDMFVQMKAGDGYIVCVQMQLIRKKFLADCGLRFCEGILHEDELFTFLLLMESRRCTYLPEPFFQRRIRSGSVMTVPRTENNLTGLIRSMEGMLDYYRTHSFADATVQNAVEEHLAKFFRTILHYWHDLKKQQGRADPKFKKQLFAAVKRAGCFNRDDVASRCRFDWWHESAKFRRRQRKRVVRLLDMLKKT